MGRKEVIFNSQTAVNFQLSDRNSKIYELSSLQKYTAQNLENAALSMELSFIFISLSLK